MCESVPGWPPPETALAAEPSVDESPTRRHMSLLMVIGAVWLALVGGILLGTRLQTGNDSAALDSEIIEFTTFRPYFNRAMDRVDRSRSIEISYTVSMPDDWMREELHVDGEKGQLADRSWWSDESLPGSAPADVSLVKDISATYIHAPRYDDETGSNERWFVMEGKAGTDRAEMNHIFALPAEILMTLENAEPIDMARMGTYDDVVMRYDLIVPAAEFLADEDARLTLVLGFALDADATASVWIAEDGEVQQILIKGQFEGTEVIFELESKTSDRPGLISLPDPSTVESWDEFIASREND